MPKITLDIPSDVKDVISKHTEIDWNKLISDILWNYAKKLRLLDSIASKSKLGNKDVEAIDHIIKASLANKYQAA